MIEFHLDGRSGVAPYMQLIQQVRQAMRLGLLAEGEAAVIRPLGAQGFRIVARIPKDGWDALAAR